MGTRRWKKKGQGSQRKDAEFLTLVQKLDRPLPSSGPSFDSVPNWEKRFCSQMKWQDFCNKKRIVHIFPNVLDWDDSAGKEAFDAAKARYWVEINNLPSKIPLPDPNMYIQEVDDDAYIDPLLLEDLYESPPPPPESPDLDSIHITPTGWDVVDPSPSGNVPEFIFVKLSTADDTVDSSTPIRPTGWGDSHNQSSENGITAETITVIPTGWGDEKDWEFINDASTLNNTEKNVENMFEKAENSSRGWKQDERNDKRYGRRGGDKSFGSNHANLRCHEQGGYQKDRWAKYSEEQYFWRQKTTLGRGLSCTPENH